MKVCNQCQALLFDNASQCMCGNKKFFKVPKLCNPNLTPDDAVDALNESSELSPFSDVINLIGAGIGLMIGAMIFGALSQALNEGTFYDQIKLRYHYHWHEPFRCSLLDQQTQNQKSYNQLCHHKRYKAFPVLGVGTA